MKPTMFFYPKYMLVQVFLCFAIFTFHCTCPFIKILKVRRAGVREKAIFRKSVTVLSAKRMSKWIQLFFSMRKTQVYIFLLFWKCSLPFPNNCTSFCANLLAFRTIRAKKKIFFYIRGDLKYRFVFEATANVKDSSMSTPP